MKIIVFGKSGTVDTIYVDSAHYDEAAKDVALNCGSTDNPDEWIYNLRFCLNVPEQNRMDLHYPIFGYSFETRRVYIFREDTIVRRYGKICFVHFELSNYFECDFLENKKNKLKLLGAPFEFHREWLMTNLTDCAPAMYLGANCYYDCTININICFKNIEPNCIKKEDLIKLSELWIVGKQMYLYQKNDGQGEMWELDCETTYYLDKTNITRYWPMFLNYFLGKMDYFSSSIDLQHYLISMEEASK